MRLNVGAGEESWGDVRIDVVRKYLPNATLNFLADARFLPFRSEVFDKVRVHEVLEHIDEWEKALNECCRVCVNEISITFPIHADRMKLLWPNLFNPFTMRLTMKDIKRLRPQHKWQFTKEVLKKVLRKRNFRLSKENVIFHPSGTHPFLMFLKYRRLPFRKYFRWLTSYPAFRKPMRWHIIGVRNKASL